MIVFAVVDQLEAEPNEGMKTYNVAYVPQLPGMHKVSRFHFPLFKIFFFFFTHHYEVELL